MEHVTLNNGVVMPMLGYGVYQVDPAECERCVGEAIDVGYRSIDTAQAYRNESGVGAAVAASGVPREELFLTTKVWISNAGEARAAASIEESLRALGTDYIDLLLIHQPFGDYYGSYRAMEQALADGKVRAIGVSNFYPDRLIDICRFADVVPAVNQVETHPLHQQAAAHEVMAKYGVVHESWGPFAEGRKDLFTNPVLEEVGAAHGKSVAQVALRFLVQSDVVVIPKSVHRERMAQNLAVFDFALDEAEMQSIRGLDEGESAFFSHYAPATVEMLTGLGNPRR
ncbi:MAG: aldo/keto reductase [Austwickia sp.]|jgi:2,5-diketo-D-gluconate reductase A|nr:MAG: aldo/keto reductase [Austwickia sp.]